MFEGMIKRYAETGKGAKEILKLLYYGTPGQEENMYYDLLSVMGGTYQEIEKKLEDDASDDVYFWFTIGRDEEPIGLQQPYCEWEKKLAFETRREAEIEHKKQQKVMNGDRDFVTYIRRASKKEEAAEEEIKKIKRKVFDCQNSIDTIPKMIEKFQKKYEEAKTSLPEYLEEMKKLQKEFEEKFGRKCWY